MTDADLEAIEARALQGTEGIASEGGGPSAAADETCRTDVPRLVAEVRRLRTDRMNALVRVAMHETGRWYAESLACAAAFDYGRTLGTLERVREVLGPDSFGCSKCCEGCRYEGTEALRLALEGMNE